MAIEEGLSRGEPYGQIGARVGVSKQRIHQLARKLDLIRLSHRSLPAMAHRRAVDAATLAGAKAARKAFDQEIVRRLLAGESGTVVCKSMGIRRGRLDWLRSTLKLVTPRSRKRRVTA